MQEASVKLRLDQNRLIAEVPVLQAGGVLLGRDLHLELPAGVLGLIRGANGVGKSTLLRQLANSCTSMPSQTCFLLKPDFGFRDEMWVADQFACMAPGIDASFALAEVGLLDWQHERVLSLSSGQRARLAIAVMEHSESRLWLLDEPMNALDDDGLGILALILKRHLDRGGFVLMASHGAVEPLLMRAEGVSKAELELTGRGIFQVSPLPHGVSTDWLVKSPRCLAFQTLFHREWQLALGSPQAILWAGLFHWLVLSFFGIGLLNAQAEIVRVLVLTTAMLAMLIGVKDWFGDDMRVGWLQHLQLADERSLGLYWLIRCALHCVLQLIVLLPVTLLIAFQFDLAWAQTMSLGFAVFVSVWSMTPLLGILGILVLLTRGGSVLVYLLALPLLVPMLVFGLETSQAAEMGRSAFAPAIALALIGVLGFLAGIPMARRLFKLVQE